MRNLQKINLALVITIITLCSAFKPFAQNSPDTSISPGNYLASAGVAGSLSHFLADTEDPVSFVQKLHPGNDYTASAFGVPVAISGDTAVVGAPGDQIGRNKKQGAVHVFVQEKGVWIHQAKLIAADGRRHDEFGRSVAIDGNTIVVGVALAQIGADKDQGAAYVFERQGDNWGRQVKLVASGGGKSHGFGTSVGVSGETIIVGAIGVDNYPGEKYTRPNGAAYIFTRINNEWNEKQKITGDSMNSLSFGINVAIDGKTAAVSALLSDPADDADHEIYIFGDSGTGWKKEHKIQSKRSGDLQMTGFSTSSNVALDGNTLVVGGTEGPEKTKNGTVFVYIREAGKWVEQARLKPISGEIEKTFGWSVDISGDNIVVGEFIEASWPKGVAYFFKRKITNDGIVWVPHTTIEVPGSEMTRFFGSSVGISGDRMLIGAAGIRVRRQDHKGAFVYQIGTPTP